jgi:hypothetical protein
MIGPIRAIILRMAGLLALGLLVGLPARAAAEAIIIKNETMAPVIVHGSYIFRGQVKRGKPHQLQPGDTVTLQHPGAGLKLTITIFDARLPVIIGQDHILPAVKDQYVSIQPDTMPPKVKLEPTKNPPP